MQLHEVGLSEDDLSVRDLIRRIAEDEIRPRARTVDEAGEFTWESFRILGEAGLLGILIPEQWGGGGGTMLQYAIIVEEIARACGSTSATFMTQTHGMLPILAAGDDEQRARWLPALASGKGVSAIAITEPGAGTDIASMRTTARREGDDYILDGSKTFITNGGVADVICLFATVDRALGRDGISVFVVPGDTPGLDRSQPMKKMGIRGSNTAELTLDDVRIPAANRLGEEGSGFKLAVTVLSDARISTAAQAVGLAQGAYDLAFEYVLEREQFGHPVYDFQAVQLRVADMYAAIMSGRLMVQRLARMIDGGHGTDRAVEASMAKFHCSDMAMDVTTRAVELLGGYGYMREYEVERFMRDAKITQIYDGTNDVNRLVMARQLRRRLQGGREA